LRELVQQAISLPYSEIRSQGLIDLIAEEVGTSPRSIYERIRRSPASIRLRNLALHQKTLFEEIDEAKNTQRKQKRFFGISRG